MEVNAGEQIEKSQGLNADSQIRYARDIGDRDIWDSTIKIDSYLGICYPNCMPKKSRIDAPRALHHIIVKGK